MDKPTVGQVICFRVTGEKRRINNDEWFIESDSSVVRRREAEQTNFAYVPVEPIDPARVTIAEPPERFTVTGFGGVECDGRVLFTCVDSLNALDACKYLKALDRAAKEPRNG